MNVVSRICAAALLTGGLSAGAFAQEDPGVPFSATVLGTGLTLTREQCAALPNAVWVVHEEGTDCIRYYPSPDVDGARRAQFYFHGDRLAGGMVLGAYEKVSPATLTAEATRQAKAQNLPFIYMARPGVYGSSGNHRQRRQPREFHALNAAVDAIKARYRIERIVLGGQSGGATVTAALLTLGRTDVDCAVATSGNYAVLELAAIKYQKAGAAPRPGFDVTGYANPYDVIRHVDGIKADPARRIVLIGDPRDQNTVFSQQRAFFQKVQAAGHAVMLLEGKGTGPDNHSLTPFGYAVAGLCAAGRPDAELAAKVSEMAGR